MNPDIDIEVSTQFLANESDTENGHYLFSYTITITNHSSFGIKLLSRKWSIEDANNRVQQVEGEGVVGQQPHIKSGESFRYTSGVILETPVGIMEGHYEFMKDDGDIFPADIPRFSLADPMSLH